MRSRSGLYLLESRWLPQTLCLLAQRSPRGGRSRGGVTVASAVGEGLMKADAVLAGAGGAALADEATPPVRAVAVRGDAVRDRGLGPRMGDAGGAVMVAAHVDGARAHVAKF